MPTPVLEAIARSWPPSDWAEVNVVVAVSGGRDSVTLLHALCQLHADGAGRLLVAHLNHRLRGGDSDADEQFVRDLGETLSVAVEVKCVDVAADARSAGDGIEAAARNARYEFLKEVARRHGARFVATAHTADDQVETILHRILRGTGIAGLAGMSTERPLDAGLTLVRPLLSVSRAEIDAYLLQQEIAYRDDASNMDVQFTRNRLRHDLLPKLRADYNPSVDEALLRLASLAGECQSVIEALVGDLAHQCVEVRHAKATIQCAALVDQPNYLIRELLMHTWRAADFPQQSMGKTEWNTLAALVDVASETRVRNFPGGIRATRKGDQLALTRP